MTDTITRQREEPSEPIGWEKPAGLVAQRDETEPLAIVRTPTCQSLMTQLLREGHGVRFRAHGGSMHPTIRDGALLTVAPAQPRELVAGDIVLYRTTRGVIAHRLVRVTGTAERPFYVCRGDSTRDDDAPVTAEAVIGRVVEIERAGRRRPARRFRRPWVAAGPLRTAWRSGVAGWTALVARLRLPRRLAATVSGAPFPGWSSIEMLAFSRLSR
jgi:signal peptidase I